MLVRLGIHVRKACHSKKNYSKIKNHIEEVTGTPKQTEKIYIQQYSNHITAYIKILTFFNEV